MKVKQVAFFISIFLVMSLCAITFAERNPLNPPALLSLNPEKYLNEDYKQSLGQLKAFFEKSENKKVRDIASALYKTTRKDIAKELKEELFYEIKKYEERNIVLSKDIKISLEKIAQMIEDGSFNNYQTGVSFEVDEKYRKYIVSWAENGKEIIKRTPFVPEMKLNVKANYVSKIKDKKEIMVYQYWIENKKESDASFIEFYLESKFPQNYIMEKIKSRFGKMSFVLDKSSTDMQRISYPEGYLNYFIFWNYNSTDEKLIKYPPGSEVDYPFEIEEIEKGLPGIIECSIPVSHLEFNPTSVISPEKSPEIAVDIVSGKSLGSHGYRYWGKTIGPVPIPEPFDRQKFIDQIISYNNQTIEEGWNDKQEVINYTKDGLETIRKDLGSKNLIKEFLNQLEGYNKKEMILSEAYALLKYNLEYLLTTM